VVTTIILVIPGFVALSLILATVGISKKVEFSEYLVWSFFLSGLMDLVMIVSLGLPLPPSTNQFLAALTSWPGVLAYPVQVLVFALAGAFVLRGNFPKYLQKIVWWRAKSRRPPTLLWDDSLEAHFEQWVVAETKEGQFISGLLLRYSTGSDPQQIYLGEPELIVFAADKTQQSHSLGKAILLDESNLSSLRFLSGPKDVTIRLS